LLLIKASIFCINKEPKYMISIFRCEYDNHVPTGAQVATLSHAVILVPGACFAALAVETSCEWITVDRYFDYAEF